MVIVNKLISIGIALLFLGIIFIFAGSVISTFSSKESKSNVKSAGIIFIGPFPFGWASDKNMFYALIGITIILIMIYITIKK